ncbi:MAG: ABC transporter permease [Rhodanobacteraceae bacterium]
MFGYYLQLALRRCRRSPAIVALVVLTMAIGIAACMTALAIFSALEGQPLPGISNHLYVVTMDARETANKNDSANAYSSPGSLLKLRDAKALVDAHRAPSQVALTHTYAQAGNPNGKQTDAVTGLLAYGPVLRELGAPLRFGRPWTQAEQTAHDPVAVIDSKLAEKLFGTADAVGRSVEIHKHRFQVIGVTAPWKPRTAFIGAANFGGQVMGSDLQLFLPVGAALDAGIGPETSGECGNSGADMTFGSVDVQHCRWLEVWVALKTPAALASYQRFLAGYADAQHAAGRFVDPPQAKLYGTRAWMALNNVIPDDVSLNLILAGAFLVLCMINVAGLLTARFLRRQADVAIRRALGASWRQVFAQHVVESGLLGLVGGLLALPLTLLGMWIVRKQPVGYAPAAHFSVEVFIGLLVLSLVVGMIVGILPAWRVCRLAPAIQIKQA